MNTYKLTFTINGKRTEQIVKAHSLGDAKDIIKSMYPNARISFISTGHEKM